MMKAKTLWTCADKEVGGYTYFDDVMASAYEYICPLCAKPLIKCEWVSLEELRKELVHLFLFRKDCSKVCWTDFLDELFSSPQASPLHASVMENKEGRAKDENSGSLNNRCNDKSLALPLKSVKSNWKPFCYGDYQGVGDESCFNCPYALMCLIVQRKFKKIRKVK